MECLIHTEGVQGDLIKFQDNTWRKVKAASTKRLTTWNNSKYNTICSKLPDLFDENRHGYHMTCYRHFTAIPKIEGKHSPQATSILLRSAVSADLQSTSTSEVFDRKCIFCRKRKKIKGQEETLGNCETLEAEKSIKEAANILQDEVMLVQIKNIDFVAKEVRYHHSCRKDYLNRAKHYQLQGDKLSNENGTRTKTSHNQQKHNSALKKTSDYVQAYIIDNKKAQFFNSIHARHCTYLSEKGLCNPSYTAQKLHDKLITFFRGKVKSIKLSNKQGLVLYSDEISSVEAVALATDYASTIESKVEEVALHLRKIILTEAQESKLQHPLSVNDILMGESTCPQLLELLYRNLYSGSSKPTTNVKVYRRIHSSAQDAIFICSGGRIKPTKHLSLGLGIKSMTGSRRIVEMLNHLGHSINYHYAEELETELCLSQERKTEVIPPTLQQVPNLVTGLAWDNYDANLEKEHYMTLLVFVFKTRKKLF